MKTNFYFKESEIEKLESLGGKIVADLNWPDILEKALWMKLDLEGSMPADDLSNVPKVKAVLGNKREILSELKKDILNDLENILSQLQKLSTSEKKTDLEKIISIKAELNLGKIV